MELGIGPEMMGVEALIRYLVRVDVPSLSRSTLVPQSRQAKDIFETAQAFVQSSDDLIAATLKGHLAVEALLDLIIQEAVSDPGPLKETRLRFPQKAALARSLTHRKPNHPAWGLLRALNALRNHLVHDLKAERVESLVSRLRAPLSQIDSEDYREIPAPRTDREVVIHAVFWLIGFLGAYHNELADEAGCARTVSE